MIRTFSRETCDLCKAKRAHEGSGVRAVAELCRDGIIKHVFPPAKCRNYHSAATLKMHFLVAVLVDASADAPSVEEWVRRVNVIDEYTTAVGAYEGDAPHYKLSAALWSYEGDIQTLVDAVKQKRDGWRPANEYFITRLDAGFTPVEVASLSGEVTRLFSPAQCRALELSPSQLNSLLVFVQSQLGRDDAEEQYEAVRMLARCGYRTQKSIREARVRHGIGGRGGVQVLAALEAAAQLP